MAVLAKVDFIICEKFGTWHFESHNVSKEIALKSDKEIIKYCIANAIIEDAFFVAVYWNDPNIVNEN